MKSQAFNSWALIGWRTLRRSLIALVATCLSGAAMAQDRPVEAQIDALRECRELTDEVRRLACYDAATAPLLAAIEDGSAQVVSREEVEETRRGLFGFTMPKLGLFSSDDDEIDLLESTITNVRSGRRSYEFTIEEGSVWQINSVPMRLRPPEVGDPVVLKKASLGSYFVRIDGQTGVKGKRVR